MRIFKKLSDLTNNQSVMMYIGNTSWLFGEKILRMVMGLFVGVWLARYLGPDQFGLFSYAQSFVALFAAVATLGLDGIVVRELIKNKEQRDKLLGTAFYLKLMGAILVLVLLTVSIFFQSNDPQTNWLIFVIASATIFQSFNVIDFYFQSKVQSKFVALGGTVSLVSSSVIKITLILNDASLISFAFVILFDSFILAISFIYFYLKNKLSIFSWCFDKTYAKSLLKDSWPLILSGLVVSLYMKIDQVMIKNILDNNSVGQYAAAVRLLEVWYFIPVVISSSLFPAIINAKATSKHLYYSRMQNLYNLMAWLAISIAIIVTLLSDWIVHVLYGDEFNQASGVIMIQIWSVIFVFLGVASSKWFIAEGLQKYSFYRSLSGAILNIILNLILIPMYGIEGAAIATLISQIVASYLFNVINKKSRITFFMHSKSFLLPFRKIGS